MPRKYLNIILFFSLVLIAMISITAVMTLQNLHEERTVKDRLTKTYVTLQTLLSKIQDGETGERGYVITGDSTYLQPYTDAYHYLHSPKIASFFEEQKNTRFAADYAKLQELSKELLGRLDYTVNVRQNQGFEPAKDVISTGIAKGMMDQIRSLTDSILTKQRDLLETHDENIEMHIKSVLSIILIGNAFALLFVSGCFIYIDRELRKRLKMETILSELNEWQTAILDSTNQAVITLDFNGDILSYNSGAQNLFGFSAPEMLHQSILKLYEATNNTNTLQQLSRRYGNQFDTPLDFILFLNREGFSNQNTSWEVRRRDKSFFTFSCTFTPLANAKGEIRGSLLVGNDVTQRQKWENEIILAKQRAQSASETKSRFLAAVSHDLRTPLNSIIGFSNLLIKNKDHNLTEEQLSYLKRVVDNGKHLLGLINTILDLNKIEEGKTELNITPINLNEFIPTIYKQLESQITEKKLDFQTEIPDDLLPLHTDPQKLTQILINLMSNAIKFTSEGYIKIRVLKDDKTNRPAQIDVIDTGSGIDKANQKKVFEVFYQIESKQPTEGWGLGLSIAAALSKILNFDLRVNSESGHGSTFSLLLITHNKPQELIPVPQQTEVNAMKIPKKTVLVVDDEEDARYLLKKYFEEVGCEVVAAASGHESLEILKQRNFDLITVDLKMTPMDGYEVIDIVQQDEKLKKIPIALISIKADEARGKLHNIKAYLNKPVTEQELQKLLQNDQSL